ncbi:YeiH family protein [Flavobacterium gawalongense]|uniref:Sulfate exporter family transporter n=1 Tax=Flavobacterium gawalongense TaxID=2594432 RepID=A0A553B917_9FLAO|nr:putative sulfate exporter family transporter [Flavobacterium gawalongense]TRX04723.1 putative sulfate exporter family transporter [Flavobacterium gawalongense]TRX04774.1 putative sulfate exporter family transporter [Flavobacterium gawalongense]TRX05218.1 putative sulfate exporter family transporter [Flavobacterium gawalongense]TRX21171.1 putative sulfate exporter family transporter [Flavobacterium gawalongense]
MTTFVSPPIALLLGLIVANLSGHPFLHLNHKATNILLQVSVVGLGFGMNVNSALSAGKEGFLFTVASILSTLILGTFLGKWLKIEKKTAHLISCGTAICGGSAIAAIAPVIKSEDKQTSIALGVIFILNSIALFLFPAVGHWLDLSQKEFGLWCAIAIHDTSSVVGAASKFGPEALQIATTVKLARVLWIIPVALITAVVFKNKSSRIKIPYFIGLFILAMVMNNYVSKTAIIAPYLVSIAKIGLTLTLFLIGAGLNRSILKSVGVKPLFQGILLWIFIAIATLLTILYFN